MLTHHRSRTVSRSRVEKGQIAKQYASGGPQDLSTSLIHGSSDHRKRTEQPMELLDKFVGYCIFSYRELIGNKKVQADTDRLPGPIVGCRYCLFSLSSAIHS